MKRFLILALFISIFFNSHAFARKGQYRGVGKIITNFPLRKVRNKVWSRITDDQIQNFKILLDIIQESDTGNKVLAAAQRKAATKGQTLYDVLEGGKGSLTDTTLIRKFHFDGPVNVVYESRSKVYLNRDLTVAEAILDLVHELTHFTYREAFNPYSHKFSLNDFIKMTIEGNGGEVDAFIMECKVLFELYPSPLREQFRCHRVLGSEGRVSRKQAITQFYKLGKYYSAFKKILNIEGLENEFQVASAEEVEFISSAYGLPYPLAAVQEYQNVLKHSCQNDEGRLEFLQESLGRSPASLESQRGVKKVYNSLLQSYSSRCKSVSKDSTQLTQVSL